MLRLKIIFFLFSLYRLALPGFAEEKLSVAALDIEALYDDFYKTKESRVEIENERNKIKAEVSVLFSDLNQKIQAYQSREAQVLASAKPNEPLDRLHRKELEEMMKPIQALQEKIKILKDKSDNQGIQSEAALRKAFLKHVRKLITDINKQGAVDLICDTSIFDDLEIAHAIYAHRDLDKTSQALSSLNMGTSFNLPKLEVIEMSKIITVDLEQVYKDYEKAIQAEADIRSQFEASKIKLDSMIAEGEAAIEVYKEFVKMSQDNSSSKSDREAAKLEANLQMKKIRSMQMEVKNFAENTPKLLKQNRISQGEKRLEEIFACIRQYAEKENVLLALNSEPVKRKYLPGSVFENTGLDRTSEVIAILNSRQN